MVTKKKAVVAKKSKINTAKKNNVTKNNVTKKNKNLNIDNNNSNNCDIESKDESTSCCNNKYWIIILILIILIWWLWFIMKDKIKFNNNSNWITNTWTSLISNKKIIKSWDVVKVDYVWKLEDGSIFDSSIESYAKQSTNYNANRPYWPLEFTVWQWQMIPWFDNWIIWMNIWEKKTIKILAKDAYWEKIINQDIPSEYFQDTITQTVPINNFQDTITQTVPKNLLWDKLKDIKEWDTIEIESWLNWKILKLEESNVTIEIQNTANPFYWKKLEKWLQTNYEWNLITIKDLNDSDVTIEVENKQNPFYWKTLTVWMVWILPNWEEIKILNLSGSSVSVEMNNPHNLAWKNLIFDVEVKEIK